jgi:sulfite exporter TauE/SafE
MLESIGTVGVPVAGGQSVELVVFLLIGLLGGAHCIGMCGPLVTMYSARIEGSDDGLSWYEVRQHALFNAGRTGSYALIGGAFGLLGLLTFDAAAVGSISGEVRAVVGILAGVFIVSVGVYRVFGLQGSILSSFSSNGKTSLFSRVYGLLTDRVNEWANGAGIVGLGAIHGVLPCPLLYPAFLYAFTQGSPLGGALDLAILGLGTFPTVFLYGTVVQSMNPHHRATVHRVIGGAFLVLGYIPLAHGLNLLGVHVPMLKPPVYQPLG